MMPLHEDGFRKRVALTLWVGLMAALVCVVAGIIWLGSEGRNGQGAILLQDLPRALGSGDPAGLVSLGVLLLLLTPVAVVVVSFVHFLARREAAWASIALAVLAVLAIGFVAGLG